MKCFRHHSEDAVGICKSCGKGVCPKCTTELTNGLACKDSCEKRVNLINRTLDNNQNVISASNKQIKNIASMGVIVGVLLAISGIYFMQFDKVNGGVFIAIGIVFILSGIMRLAKKSQYPVISDGHHKK